MSQAGKMRQRARIEQRSSASGPDGERAAVWDLFATRWCSIEPMSQGSEIVASQQRQGRLPTVIKMRSLDGVIPAMRVVPVTGPLSGHWFNILAVQYVEDRRHDMVLVTEELAEMAT